MRNSYERQTLFFIIVRVCPPGAVCVSPSMARVAASPRDAPDAHAATQAFPPGVSGRGGKSHPETAALNHLDTTTLLAHQQTL